ncbi:MAG TPA: hypothetical protein VGQ92_19005 [Actinoplanes sp.]|nr:hypothetical protein [Actinoplanes sp.]
MTEKIRALLDEAVAGVGPRDPDPVPDLLRRGRARRRHLAVAGAAGAVAVAVLATGAIVATNRSMPDNPPASQPSTSPSSEVKGQKEEPVRIEATVAGGFVRTGGLAVPIPQGWQVIQDKRLDRCDIPADSVLINVMQLPGGSCNLYPQISVDRWGPHALPAMVSELGTVSEVILPAGQPVWLDINELGHMRSVRKKAGNRFTVAQPSMPWANVGLTVQGQKSQIDAVLRGISADPVTPARLTLPRTSAAVQLNLGDDKQLTSTDQAVIEQVLGLLSALGQPVRTGELPCAGAEQVTDTWRLAGTEMAGLTFTDAKVHTASATVAISTGDSCAFATSSLGGRVHLPAGFLARVEQLLGGR